MSTVNEIREALSRNDNARALELSERYVAEHPDDAEGWFVRGKALWRVGERQAATGCYAQAASIDSDSPAVAALENARDIERFFNPDLLNP